MGTVRTPHSQLPYEVDVEADRMIERPASQWDKDAILRENIASKINVRAQFGRRQEKQDIVQLDIQAERSPEQKSFARNSESWKKCDRDLAKNQQLSDSCKWASKASPRRLSPGRCPSSACPWTGRGALYRRWPGGARGLRALRSGPLPTLPLSMNPGNARKQDADNQKTKL